MRIFEGCILASVPATLHVRSLIGSTSCRCSSDRRLLAGSSGRTRKMIFGPRMSTMKSEPSWYAAARNPNGSDLDQECVINGLTMYSPMSASAKAVAGPLPVTIRNAG